MSSLKWIPKVWWIVFGLTLWIDVSEFGSIIQKLNQILVSNPTFEKIKCQNIATQAQTQRHFERKEAKYITTVALHRFGKIMENNFF